MLSAASKWLHNKCNILQDKDRFYSPQTECDMCNGPRKYAVAVSVIISLCILLSLQ